MVSALSLLLFSLLEAVSVHGVSIPNRPNEGALRARSASSQITNDLKPGNLSATEPLDPWQDPEEEYTFTASSFHAPWLGWSVANQVIAGANLQLTYDVRDPSNTSLKHTPCPEFIRPNSQRRSSSLTQPLNKGLRCKRCRSRALPYGRI